MLSLACRECSSRYTLLAPLLPRNKRGRLFRVFYSKNRDGLVEIAIRDAIEKAGRSKWRRRRSFPRIYRVSLARLDRLTGPKSLFMFLTSRGGRHSAGGSSTALWKLRYLRSCTGSIQSRKEAGERKDLRVISRMQLVNGHEGVGRWGWDEKVE